MIIRVAKKRAARKRVPKKLVQKFTKETNRHKINLIAGINPKPPDPSPNAIFYIRMESEDKKTNEIQHPEPIYLTLNEMLKLSVLMSIASKFWVERLEKGSSQSLDRINKFVDTWKQVSGAMNELLEKSDM